MDFRDKDGNPLIYWNTPEGAFDVWRKISHNMLCDYSGYGFSHSMVTAFQKYG